jgi:hypothetical protein
MSNKSLTVAHGKVIINHDTKTYTALNGDYFQMFKNPQTTELNTTSNISVWDYMFNLTTAQRWLITQILNSYNYKNNTAYVNANTEVEKNYIKHGYKKLYEDGWICRVKRSYYMISPSILKMSSFLILDALLQWNAHCHLNAVIKINDTTNLKSYDIDVNEVLSFIDSLILQGRSDQDLLSSLNILKTLNWVDASNQITSRCSNPHNIEPFLDECKKRNLI